MGRLPFSKLKAFFSKVLFEEFGLATPEGFANNHVSLSDAFILSLGTEPFFCKDPNVELTENLKLLDDVTEHVKHSPLAFAIELRGMGTGCLCQVYLTAIFDLAKQNPNIKKKAEQLDLRFESLHRGEVEAQHRIQMRQRIAALIHEHPGHLIELKSGYELARQSFHIFFKNIDHHIDTRLNIKREKDLLSA